MAFANFFADYNFIKHKVGRAGVFLCLFVFVFYQFLSDYVAGGSYDMGMPSVLSERRTMGKYDVLDKEYFSEVHRQSELIANGVYHGKVTVPEGGLIKLKGSYPSLTGESGQLERDILSYCPEHGMKYGMEVENYPDYGMPRRILTYDACEYEKEAKELRTEHERKKDYADFVEKKSGMNPEEFHTPVTNAVLYLGEGHYRGRRTLRECFHVPEEMKEYVSDKIQNYSFHLIEADYVNPKDYKTELRQFFEAMQARKDKKKLRELLEREDFQNLTTETKKMIAIHLNHRKLIKKAEEEEDFEMCKAIKDLINDGKMEGREEGRAEGRAEGKVEGSILICKKLGIDIETVIANIREEYHLSYPEAKKKIELYW